MSDAPLLEARNLTRRFGALMAVDDVSFSVPAGQVFGIAGPNGSGKSTLFNIITGIPFPPTSGEVLLSGKPVHRMRPHQISRAGVLRTFQKDAEFATLSAFENVYTSAVYCAGASSADGGACRARRRSTMSSCRRRAAARPHPSFPCSSASS